MRILSVVTQLESGGAQTVAIELHREFLRRGIGSHLAFLYEKDSSVFPQRDYSTMLNRPAGSPLDFGRIVQRLRACWAEFKPDAIFAHTHFTNNICAMAKASGCSGNVVAVHHNLFESYPAASRVLDRIGRSLGLYAAEISVSDPVFRSLPSASAKAVRPVILNGQSLTPSALSPKEARDSFNLPQDCFLIGNIGRLSEQKNQAFLIDLLPQLPQARLAILGEGHLRDALVEQAQRLDVMDRITLIGAVVHERVPDFLRALDLFAMPSLYEGMSIAMLEALAAGVPFIGNDVPTIAEVVNDGEGGAGLVAPLDQQRWVELIESLQHDRTRWEQLSTRQIRRAADFSITHMADRYIEAAEMAGR